MRWSAKKLRWLLLTGVLLLAVVVAGFFGLARYRAGKIWQRILARNGVNLRQETNGFTWSQSSKGRTIFTLHASKATPLGKNKYALHDAVLILYGREPGRDDRIYGKEFQYDQDAGVARAMGEVHMDLQAPEPGGKAPPAGSLAPLSFEQGDEAAETPGMIHVRTSGVVYMHKLGLAATGEMTELRYGGITCTSRGAEFDSAQSVVRLLADVRMTGTQGKAAYVLNAGRVELNRSTDTADLAAPVLVSGLRSARAAHALLHLHKDGSLQAAEANGAVEIRSGTQTVSAPQAAGVFGAENRLQHARLFTGVRLVDTDRAKPGQGSAGTMDLSWSEEGLLSSVAANGAVRFSGTATAADGSIQRQLAADQLMADLVPESGEAGRKAVLRRVHLTGKAALGSTRQPLAAGGRAVTNSVSGDDLVTTFAPGPGGKVAAQDLVGTGHTRLEQVGADGAHQQSTGDSLQVTFAQAAPGAAVEPGGQDVAAAVQTGHVTFMSVPGEKQGSQQGDSAGQTTGKADRAEYAGASRTLTLVGTASSKAELHQSQGDVGAERIVLQQSTGDAEATGGVIATSLGRDSGPATHILASRARLLHAAGLTEFYGETGRPAQLWQAGSQVLAAEITLDERRHGMAARPASPDQDVRAVFATAGSEQGSRSPSAASKAGAGSSRTSVGGGSGTALPEAARSAVQVSAAAMDYDDVQHQAVFTGRVRLSGALGEVTADRGTATLRAPEAGKAPPKAGLGDPDLSGSLERMVLLGDVKLSQLVRTGIGQQLTYTAATDSFVLTGSPGKPPRVMGERGSLVTGATLLFRNADSTIVVAGTEDGPKAPGGTRVHTETDLKQKP